MSFKIRRAQIKPESRDLDIAARFESALKKEVFGDYDASNDSEKTRWWILREMERKRLMTNILFAEEEGISRGYVNYFTRDAESFVNSLYVDRDYRSKGIGTTLLNIAIKDAKNKGASIVRLTPSRGTENFYMKRGFSHSDRYPGEAGLSLRIG